MLTEEQKRMHRVCFTGHRPEKLKQSESVIVKSLETAIKDAIADGKNVFISGMARGVDIWAAEIVLRLRKEGANVKLIVPAHMKALSVDGVPNGNDGTMSFLPPPTLFVLSVRGTAEPASRSAMNGWSTIRHW